MTTASDILSSQGITAALLFAPVGVALGLAFFLSLRVNARLYVTGKSVGMAIAIHLTRIVGAAVAFGLVATQGAGALLGAFAGFLLARLVVARPPRETS